MHVRQIALVARELEPVVERLCSVLGVEVCFHDPGVAEFGLRNALMPIGDQFLEVVCPVREDATAARYLARRGGDGGYMVILQTDALARDRARLDALGVRVVWSITLPDIATLHLHPKDLPGAITSLDEPRPPESWRWGGPSWRDHVRAGRVSAIRGVRIQSAEPQALARRWGEVLDRPVEAQGPGARVVLDHGHRIDFVPLQDARGEGLVALELRATDAAAVRAAARETGCLDPADRIVVGGVAVELVTD